MNIVLFGGRGSGKDTVGDYLVAKHGFTKVSFAAPLKQMVKIAFPDFTDEDLYGPSKNRENQYKQYPMGNRCLKCDSPLFENSNGGLSCTQPGCLDDYPRYVNPRIALQTLGTEWGRRLFGTVWIDNLFSSMYRARQNWKARSFAPLFSSPMQPAYENVQIEPEPQFVVTDGRFINEQRRSVELGGTTVLLLRKLEDAAKATHASERELSEIPRERFQYVLDNGCPLEELPSKIEEMLRHLRYDPSRPEWEKHRDHHSFSPDPTCMFCEMNRQMDKDD